MGYPLGRFRCPEPTGRDHGLPSGGRVYGNEGSGERRAVSRLDHNDVARIEIRRSERDEGDAEAGEGARQ